MRRLYALLLPIFLTGCELPTGIIPIVGKPHFGNTTTNVYHGSVEQVQTPWQLYFWALVVISALIFTPLGGLLISRLRRYAKALRETTDGIERSGITEVKDALSRSQSTDTKKLVKHIKAKL